MSNGGQGPGPPGMYVIGPAPGMRTKGDSLDLSGTPTTSGSGPHNTIQYGPSVSHQKVSLPKARTNLPLIYSFSCIWI